MRTAPTSRMVALFAILGLPPALLAPWSPMWLVVTLAVDGALLTLWLVDGYWLGREEALTVRRELPEKLPLLRPATVKLFVTNLGRARVALRLRDTHPEQLQVEVQELAASIQPRQTVELLYEVVPTRRGRFSFGDIALWIEGGAGLAVRRRQVSAQREITVSPDLHLINELVVRRRNLHQLGVRQSRTLGAGREFDRLREYHSDDDYRHINWKATARHGKPITSVYQLERGQDIVLAIDTSRMMGLSAGGRTKLDAAIEAALLLARAALYYEDNVALVTFSTGADTFLPPRRGSSQISRVVGILGGIQHQPTIVSFRQTFQFIASRCRRRALVVCFTDLLDEDHARDMLQHLPLLRRRHLPLFVTVSDQGVVDMARRVPANEREAYEAVVAEEMLADRQSLVRALEKRGALLVDVPAGELSVATISAYLKVKSAQLL